MHPQVRLIRSQINGASGASRGDCFATSPRLAVRPLEHGDTKDIAKWMQLPELRRAYLVQDEIEVTTEALGALVQASCGLDGGLAAWAILDQDGQLVGMANWKEDIPWRGVYEMEAVLTPDIPRRRGLGLEAHWLIAELIFGPLRARKLIGRAAAFNAPSLAIMDRGATREGTLRRHAVIDGEEFDIAVYGILREEWLSSSESIAGHLLRWWNN